MDKQIGYDALIERDDGTCYIQHYSDFYDLVDLQETLGADYKIVQIY